MGFAERSARDASRELQNVETSVSFAKKKVRDLTAQAECASCPAFPLCSACPAHRTLRLRARSRQEQGRGWAKGPRHAGCDGRGGAAGGRGGGRCRPHVRCSSSVLPVHCQLTSSLRSDLAGADSIQKFYDTVLIKAQKNHTCIGCDRSISRDELPDLERYVRARLLSSLLFRR